MPSHSLHLFCRSTLALMWLLLRSLVHEGSEPAFSPPRSAAKEAAPLWMYTQTLDQCAASLSAAQQGRVCLKPPTPKNGRLRLKIPEWEAHDSSVFPRRLSPAIPTISFYLRRLTAPTQTIRLFGPAAVYHLAAVCGY